MYIYLHFCYIILIYITAYAARDIQMDIRLLRAREDLLDVLSYLFIERVENR